MDVNTRMQCVNPKTAQQNKTGRAVWSSACTDSLAELVLLAIQLNDNINLFSENTECQCAPLNDTHTSTTYATTTPLTWSNNSVKVRINNGKPDKISTEACAIEKWRLRGRRYVRHHMAFISFVDFNIIFLSKERDSATCWLIKWITAS